MPKAANHLDRCRLCDQNLRIFGTLQHVRSLVSKSNCTILTRLSSLGINLTLHEDTSTIICQKCFRNICKVEKTMHVLHAWKATTQTPAFGTPGEEVIKSQQGPVETGRDDTKTRCFNCDSLNEVPEKKRQREESPPTTGRGAKKRCNASTQSPEKNIMVEVAITLYLSITPTRSFIATTLSNVSLETSTLAILTKHLIQLSMTVTFQSETCMLVV